MVTEDPLEHSKLVYAKSLRPFYTEFEFSSGSAAKKLISLRDGVEKVVEVDDPKLRQLIDDHFERHITGSIDADQNGGLEDGVAS